MTVQLADATGPDAFRSDSCSVLDLLDNAARGKGTVYFPGEESEPTPFGDLWQASELPDRWIAAHIGAGSTVAAVLTNTRACVGALFGAWRAGCTVASLPLPARGMSADAYSAQLTRFCSAAGADALLVDAGIASMLTSMPVAVHTFEATAAGAPRSTTGVGAVGALVQFTSGSVSTPKGIHLTLDAVGANCLAIVDRLAPGPGDSLCSWLPLSHDMGLIGQLLSSLVAGAPEFGHHSLTLMQPETFMANPRSWLRTCSDTGATITVVPNFALELAVRTSRRLGALDLSRLQSVIVGSESVRAETLVRFTDAFEPAGFRPLAFCPAYGLAEATVAVTIVRPNQPWRALARRDDRVPSGTPPRLVVSTGPAVEGVDVRVAAPEAIVGPIEFRSTAQLSRYIGAELSLTDDGYFATGDIGLIDDGELFVIGRGDEAIVVAGRNVFPEDIETAVEHESIRRGCIAAVAAPDGGLAVVVEPSSAMSAAELEAACRGIRTAAAGQTGVAPATVAFVPRGSLPKTPSGKLRRLTVGRALAADDGLLAGRLRMTSAAVVDRIPEMLRAELAAVTGEPVAAFCDDAQLSDVGLDSLSLIQALLSVRDEVLEELGLDVDEVEDPPALPWMETVGELIAFARVGSGGRSHRMSTVDRMHWRASVLRSAYIALLVVGIIGSVVVGIQAGKSINFDTGVLFTSTSQNNAARGVTFFVAGVVATIIATMPLLGISWIIDGQAKLLEANPQPPAT